MFRRWRARRMLRQLRELDRLDAAHGEGAPAFLSSKRPRDHERVRSALAVVVVVVAFVALGAGAAATDPTILPRGIRELTGLGPHRLLPAVTAPPSGAFTFELTQGGDPVTWDPCKPLRFKINPANSPAYGTDLILRAVARAEAATGIRFQYEGLTTDRVAWTGHTDPFGLATTAPAIIEWANNSEVPELSGRAAGLGGATATGATNRRVLTTGGVALNFEAFTRIETRPNGRANERAIVLHELGHLVGLGHSSDPTQLMFADNVGQLDYGAGDLAGLAKVGNGTCR